MTNKYIYFIANWKMFGNLNTLDSLNKVIKFSKLIKNNKFKLIYCPPYTLLNAIYNKFKNSDIDVGAQNCHNNDDYGPFTGSINSKMLKKIGANYVIIGHSENRKSGETDILLNKKIKSSIKNKLKIIFCFGESLSQKKKKLTRRVLTKQITSALNNIKNKNNIFFAYEPIWSIGTGVIPKIDDLRSTIIFIKNILKRRLKVKNPKVLYGGSVSPKNIINLKEINELDGFLIGGASQKAQNFIDIVKKTFN